MDRTDYIGVVLVATPDTRNPGLRLAIVRRDMPAYRAGAASMAWQHDNQMAPPPSQPNSPTGDDTRTRPDPE